jgi:hypothetical protein
VDGAPAAAACCGARSGRGAWLGACRSKPSWRVAEQPAAARTSPFPPAAPARCHHRSSWHRQTQPCSFGLSAINQTAVLFSHNKPAISQQYFSLRTNQHLPLAPCPASPPPTTRTLLGSGSDSSPLAAPSSPRSQGPTGGARRSCTAVEHPHPRISCGGGARPRLKGCVAGLPCLSCGGSRSSDPAAVLLLTGELLRRPTASKRQWRAGQEDWPCPTSCDLLLPVVREDVESRPRRYTRTVGWG